MDAAVDQQARAANSAFVKRLTQSLATVGLGDSPTALARAFNLRFPLQKISVHGARRWLVGETIPHQTRLECLAKWLDVAPSWLRYGEAPQVQELRSKPAGAGWPSDFVRLSDAEKDIVNAVIKGLLALRATR